MSNLKKVDEQKNDKVNISYISNEKSLKANLSCAEPHVTHKSVVLNDTVNYSKYKR